MKSKNFKVLSRVLESDIEPMLLFESCSRISNLKYRILLESSEPGTDGCQQSMLLLSQALKIEARGFQASISALNENGTKALQIINKELDTSLIVSQSDTDIVLEYPDNTLIEEESVRIKRLTPLDAIRQVLSILSNDQPLDADKLIIAGVAGYDLVDSLEKLPEVETNAADFPDYLFLLSDSQIIIDQSSHRVEIRQIIFNGENDEYRIGQARGTVNTIESIIQSTIDSSPIKFDAHSNKRSSVDSVSVHPNGDIFKSQVGIVQEGIAKGQIFQAVISRNFQLQCNNPILAYQFLKHQNPSPYQFYLQLGDYILIGASPESSLRYQHQQRTISIMPIAGTRGRGRTASGDINDELDARLEADLKLDEKELAEHLMLVDLARNDLARVAETGSRKIRELMSVYRYSAVMHMVSRIDATLRADLDIYHACQSCFHMGTLTGAPKKEAMKLIRKIENRRRGAYGGAVGYFNAAGDMDTAIVIRSALIKNNVATITAGAGVVADSIAENELKETELKATAVIRAVQFSEAYMQSNSGMES
jgi:anthranilate synthase component 1